MRTAILCVFILASACSARPASMVPTPPWLSEARILVQGEGVNNTDCRGGVCQHNENTDLTAWGGAIYLVHRTAESQVLGPNSSLRIYRSDDQGQSFRLVTVLPALAGRDLRDPHFF